jgi:hypothetical protein
MTLKFLPRPQLDAGQTQRQPVGGHCKARMHQNAAHRVHPRPTLLVLAPTGDFTRQTYCLRVLTGKRKLRRIVQHKDRPIRRGEPLLCRLKVSSQNLSLAYAIAVEKPIRRLRVGPVPARQRDRPADAFGQLLHQHAKPVAEAFVGKTAPRKLLIDP